MTASVAPDGCEAPGSAIKTRLRHRVCAGVGDALNRHRSGCSEETDIEALSALAELQAYALIPDLLRTPGGAEVTEQRVEEAIEEITHALCDDPSRLLAALYRPLSIILSLQNKPGTELSLNHQWFAWCWTSEAAWRALHSPSGKHPPALTDAEIEELVPVAARQRFLALSEPYRGVREKTSHVPSEAAHLLFGESEGTDRLFLARSRRARWEWSKLLGCHESLLALDSATPGEIEAETDLLLFECPGGRNTGPGDRAVFPRLGPPLAMNHQRLEDVKRTSRYTIEDVSLASGVAEQHLLPRYRVLATARVALSLAERPCWGRAIAAVTLCLGILALAGALASPWLSSVPLTGWSTLSFAAGLAGAAYAVGLCGITMHGRTWALPWLLRIPAAAAIGLLIVTTMHPSWWGAAFEPTSMEIPGREPGAQPPAGPAMTALFLAAAAFAYLLTNARNTGVGTCAALLRAFLVWCIASAHALLIALLGLAWIVPVFSENGHIFRNAWPLYPDAALVALLQAGAWCLVAGVFSQILWDDRPLTAPLTHTHWRMEQR